MSVDYPRSTSGEEAKDALRAAIPELDHYLMNGQMEIAVSSTWYLADGSLDVDAVLAACCKKEEAALGRGYSALRASGDASLDAEHWGEWATYEEKVQAELRHHKIIGLCTYPLKKCTASQLLQVVKFHDYALVRRQDGWECIESKGGKQILDRFLIENVTLGVTLMDRQHRILAVNGVHANMIGRPIDQCIGQECYRVFEKREAICSHCPGTRAMETGKPEEVETHGVRDDGTTYVARVQAFPVRGPDGRPEGFIEVVEDITDRKHEQDALRQAKFLY